MNQNAESVAGQKQEIAVNTKIAKYQQADVVDDFILDIR